jgi:RHS repeat-associated protein
VSGLYPTTFNYDTRGRLVSATTGSRTSSVAYDNQGNIASRTDALGSSMTYTYDSMNRLTQLRAPNSDLTAFDYDLNGNMTVLTNPKSVTNTFDYTGNNQRKTWAAPLSGSYAYTYDKERKLKTITFPSGKSISNVYAKGLLASTTTPEGMTSYSYGCGSNLSNAVRGSEKVSFTYDGSLIKTDTRSGTLSQAISYTYNNDFNLASITYAGVTQSLVYDNDGLLTSAGPYTITRNVQNGLPETVSDAVLKLTRIFSGYGEVDENTYAVNNTPVYDWTLTRDNAGRIVQKIDNMQGAAVTWNYSYDTLGRLTEVKQNNSVVEHYEYDANGNRTFETNAFRGTSNTAYSYSPEDHVLTAGADTYQFDADGFLTARITSAGTTTFTYSARGELLGATLPDGKVISYDHDPVGRRIAKRVNGTIIEKYLWQSQTRLLAVYDGSNNLIMRFTYADGRMPVSVTKDGVTYYLFIDQLGSLRAVVDGNGQIIKELVYDSFGYLYNESNLPFTIPFGFAGGLHDRDTGLIRFGLRDYDPTIGRWTVKDPIDFAGGDTNLFGYVGNNPVKFIDPWGLFTATVFDSGGRNGQTYGGTLVITGDNGNTVSVNASSWPNPTNPSPGIASTQFNPNAIDGYPGTYSPTGLHGTDPAIVVPGFVPANGPNPNQNDFPLADLIRIHCGNTNTNRGSAGCITIQPDQCQRVWDLLRNGETGSIDVIR